MKQEFRRHAIDKIGGSGSVVEIEPVFSASTSSSSKPSSSRVFVEAPQEQQQQHQAPLQLRNSRLGDGLESFKIVAADGGVDSAGFFKLRHEKTGAYLCHRLGGSNSDDYSLHVETVYEADEKLFFKEDRFWWYLENLGKQALPGGLISSSDVIKIRPKYRSAKYAKKKTLAFDDHESDYEDDNSTNDKKKKRQQQQQLPPLAPLAIDFGVSSTSPNLRLASSLEPTTGALIIPQAFAEASAKEAREKEERDLAADRVLGAGSRGAWNGKLWELSPSFNINITDENNNNNNNTHRQVLFSEGRTVNSRDRSGNSKSESFSFLRLASSYFVIVTGTGTAMLSVAESQNKVIAVPLQTNNHRRTCCHHV